MVPSGARTVCRSIGYTLSCFVVSFFVSLKNEVNVAVVSTFAKLEVQFN